MAWGGEDLGRRSLFDDPPGIHHRDARAAFRNHAEIMADQHHRHAGLALQIAQQGQDLRLRRDIQGRGRLVRNQQARLAGQRHRDHRALAHATREVMRVILQPLRRIGDANPRERGNGRRLQRLTAQALVAHQSFAQLPADGLGRVQRRRRVLEDDGDAPAAQGLQLRRTHPGDIRTVEGDAPANLRLRRQQAQRGEAGDAFAAATFADEAERLAWPDVEVDAVYHADHAAAARCEIDRDLP